MRSFVAIDLPDGVRNQLGDLIGRLRGAGVKASWTRPENLHLTLRFLGDVDAAGIEALGERLAQYCAGLGCFELAVRSVGAFPNIRKPSVVWVGLEPSEGLLARCQEAVEAAAVAHGFEPEPRPFKPHITLARIREPRRAGALRPLLEAEAGFAGDAFAVETVTLYRSELTRTGPVYTRLRDIAL